MKLYELKKGDHFVLEDDPKQNVFVIRDKENGEIGPIVVGFGNHTVYFSITTNVIKLEGGDE